jgi:hypothetical protein
MQLRREFEKNAIAIPTPAAHTLCSKGPVNTAQVDFNLISSSFA